MLKYFPTYFFYRASYFGLNDLIRQRLKKDGNHIGLLTSFAIAEASTDFLLFQFFSSDCFNMCKLYGLSHGYYSKAYDDQQNEHFHGDEGNTQK